MIKALNFRNISVYNTPEESPGYLLWQVSTQWRSAIELALKAHSLTHPQFVILASTAWLTKYNETITQAQISKAVHLDPNTTSQILRGLEKRGLITRLRIQDERGKSPQLTMKGIEKLGQALPVVETADAVFFHSLSSRELHGCIKIFQKLLAEKHDIHD